MTLWATVEGSWQQQTAVWQDLSAAAADVRLVVQVRNADGVRVAQAEDVKSLAATLRFNAAGSWRLDMEADGSGAAELTVPGAGVVVVRGDVVLWSGPVVAFERQITSQGDVLTVSGATDDVWMQSRLALPDPTAFPPSQQFDVRTGPAGDVIRAYVRANAGPSALAGRHIVEVGADQGEGNQVTGRARFEPLSDLIGALAVSGGDLGWRVTDDGGTLLFDVFEPADLAGDVVFSPLLGNVEQIRFSTRRPDGTFVFVGGDPNGGSRQFASADTESPWGRIETFADAGGATDAAELAQAADETLARAEQPATLTVDPVDTEATRWLDDYNLGDRVTVDLGGVDVVDRIRQIDVSVSSDGLQVRPHVGAPGTGETLRLFAALTETARRVDRIERRR